MRDQEIKKPDRNLYADFWSGNIQKIESIKLELEQSIINLENVLLGQHEDLQCAS